MTQRQLPSWVWREWEGDLGKIQTKPNKKDVSRGNVKCCYHGLLETGLCRVLQDLLQIYTFSNINAADPASF